MPSGTQNTCGAWLSLARVITSVTFVIGLNPTMSATLVFSCHHLVWNPKQTTNDKPEEGEDDIKSARSFCLV